MRCLTFSDLSLGSEFAGGWRGREQQCVELSLSLFRCCRPDLPLAPLLPLMGQEGTGKRGGESERQSGRQSQSLSDCPGVQLRNKLPFSLVAEEKQRRVTLLCQIFSRERKKKKKACVTLQNDGAESLTATRRKHVNALTDACYIEQL